MTQDRKYIISGFHDDTCRVWYMAERKSEVILQGHEGEVKQINLTRDNKYIVSGGGDKTVRI